MSYNARTFLAKTGKILSFRPFFAISRTFFAFFLTFSRPYNPIWGWLTPSANSAQLNEKSKFLS